MTLSAKHTFTAQGRCPLNGAADNYVVHVTIRNINPRKVVTVERILSTVDDLLKEPVFQEFFTHALSRALRAEVTTECRHGQVMTHCTAEEPRGGWPKNRVATVQQRERQSVGVKRAQKILRGLTAAQREAYRVFRRKGKYSIAEAAAMARQQ